MVVILWIVGGLVALAVLAMLLIPMFIDEQALIEMAQEQVRASTGGELTIAGETELSLFPRFGLRLEETSLDLPPATQFDQQMTASIKELDVGLSLLPLLSGNVDVGTIVISGVTADITEPQALPPEPEPEPIMSDRAWERRGEQIRDNKAQERARQLAEDAGISGVAIVAEAVRIEDITLILRTRDGILSNQIKIDALTLSQVNTDNEPMRLEGTLSVLGDGTTSPLGITLDGSIRVASDFTRIQLENLGAEVTGALTQPVISVLNGEFLMKPAKADFKLDATLPGGDVEGQLVWSALESPEIKLNISTARLDVDQIQPAAPPAAAAGNSGNAATQAPAQVATPTEQRSLPAPLPVGPLRDLDLELRIGAGELIAAGQSITDAQVLMRVLDGVADIQHIRGVLHEGQLDTRIEINARRPTVEAEVEGGLKGVNMGLLLGSLGNEGAASGRIEMGWDITTQGATSEDLMAALDGDVNAGGQDLVIEKVSIQALVCSAVAAVNKIPPITGLPSNTPITDLSLAIDFDDGEGDIEKLRFATPGVEMKGSGDVDLKTLDFGFRLEGQVNNDIMQVSPLCVIDQRYSGVDWPLGCRGNLASGSGADCKLDVAMIAQQIIENEAKQQIQDAVEEKAGSFIKKIFGG
jgi:AsmA protein